MIPISTAVCERGFSAMKRIKTDLCHSQNWNTRLSYEDIYRTKWQRRFHFSKVCRHMGSQTKLKTTCTTLFVIAFKNVKVCRACISISGIHWEFSPSREICTRMYESICEKESKIFLGGCPQDGPRMHTTTSSIHHAPTLKCWLWRALHVCSYNV